MGKEKKAQTLKIDHILALYLIDVSEHVIVNFYKAVGVFVSLLRGCLNDHGWYKLADYKIIIDSSSNSEDGAFVNKPPVFTATKSACIDSSGQSGCDMIFQLANLFCTEYLMQKCNVFDKKLATELMRHICMWISHRGFS